MAYKYTCHRQLKASSARNSPVRAGRQYHALTQLAHYFILYAFNDFTSRLPRRLLSRLLACTEHHYSMPHDYTYFHMITLIHTMIMMMRAESALRRNAR